MKLGLSNQLIPINLDLIKVFNYIRRVEIIKKYQEKLLNSRFSRFYKFFYRSLLSCVEVSSQKIFMARGEMNAHSTG